MLNETWRLLQAMEDSKITREQKHKRVQMPGRTNPCIRVRLDKIGIIQSVEDIGMNEWPNWTVMEGNQNSFPVVRVQGPLFDLPNDHALWSELGYDPQGKRKRTPPDRDRLNTLSAIYEQARFRPLTRKTVTLWKRLREQKAKELLDCAKSKEEMRAVAAVAECFLKSAKRPNYMLKKIVRLGLQNLMQGKMNSLNIIEQLIVGKAPLQKEPKKSEATIQIAFDIAIDSENPGNALYSTAVRKCLIEVLPQAPVKQASKRVANIVQEIDALSGQLVELERRTFPKADLPTPSSKKKDANIGRKSFPLTSMFSAAKCNIRYGLTDARVFPLGKDNSTHLKEALEEITADNRREKTWQHVASSQFSTHSGRKIERYDLLVAYVEEKPMLDVKTAGYFGQGSSITDAKFEVDAAVVCEALRGIVREKPVSKLNLFLIREASKGQAQVVLAESPTVVEVLEATKRWQCAVKENTPPICLYLPSGQAYDKKELREVKNARPLPPYPDQLVLLLSYQYIQNGLETRAVAGPSFGEVLALMLRTEGKWEPAARRMLNLLIHRVGPMLIGLFGAKHGYGPRRAHGIHQPFHDYPRRTKEIALRAVATLGILLNALASRKEQYMKEAPYQVGQVLALADTLHKNYCTVVRKGQLPNTLIGTSLMRRALDNPAGALADLGERMMEYVRWAKVAQVSSDWPENDQKRIAVYEARKKLRQYQPLSAALGTLVLPTGCSDIMKAQLLLGFLANPPEEDKTDEGEDDDQ